MIIGGLQKLTLLDYPEHVAAIIFTQGCNFRCHFCYNPKLVVPQSTKTQKDHSNLNESGLFEFLRSRKNKLDAVVITGGEPTLHQDLPEFIRKIKDLGFLVKLDTNGTNPDRLKILIDEKLIDYIAMDIKAPLEKYEQAVGVKVSLDKLKKSIIMIKNSGLPYEFRSTIMPALHNLEDIALMGEIIKGADKWYLQKFRSNTDLVDKSFEHKQSYTDLEMKRFLNIASGYVKFCDYR